MVIYLTIKNDFRILNVSEDVVEKRLSCINTNKAVGDQIPAKFLLLEEHKIVKLKPLFQKGSKTDPKTYRPISLLPEVPRIIENQYIIS